MAAAGSRREETAARKRTQSTIPGMTRGVEIQLAVEPPRRLSYRQRCTNHPPRKSSAQSGTSVVAQDPARLEKPLPSDLVPHGGQRTFIGQQQAFRKFSRNLCDPLSGHLVHKYTEFLVAHSPQTLQPVLSRQWELMGESQKRFIMSTVSACPVHAGRAPTGLSKQMPQQ